MMVRSFDLPGPDGANPLGFLAAVGVLVSLSEAGARQARLAWRPAHTYMPVIEGVDAEDVDALVRAVAEALRGATVSPEAEERRAAKQREMDEAGTALGKKRAEIRRRRLRGAARSEAIERELRPLEEDYQERRRGWLDALREAVPRPELALGKRIDCTPEEYRLLARDLAVNVGPSARGPLDLLAAFGNDACRQRDGDAIEPTPFCFITGSGHQYFLQTVRELIARVSDQQVHRVLFQPWDYRDEGLSMRWDPIEDRRYALSDRDPSDQKVRTMWMANLLAYRALGLFTTAPAGNRLGTAGWSHDGESFTWPLWTHPLSMDAVRSVVQHRELSGERPDALSLRERGIIAAYRARRVEVGRGLNRKVNFSAARRIA